MVHERLRHRRRRREQLLHRQRPRVLLREVPDPGAAARETVRIYLANLTEFDLINSFHLHGEFFRYYPTGSTDHFEYTDTVMLCQGQRGIIEIDFPNTGPLHVPRAPVGVRRARLDGLLRGGRLSGSRLGRRAAARAARWRLWALVPIVLLVGVVSLFASTRRLAARPRRRRTRRRRRVRHPPGRVQAGRDHDPGDEPAARGADDRARSPSTTRSFRSTLDGPTDARPPALERRSSSRSTGSRTTRISVGVTSSTGIQTTARDRRRGRDARRERRRASSATRSSASSSASCPSRSGSPGCRRCAAPTPSGSPRSWR